MVVATAGELDAAYVRLRVANQKGKDTADDVVVVVTEHRRLTDSEEATVEATPIELPLTWSGSNPPLSVASVHPGSERRIDLLHVDHPAGDEVETAETSGTIVPLRLDLAPKPTGGHDTLAAGSYEISIEVRARNADTNRYTIRVVWDGSSVGTEVTDRLRVEQPRKVR